MKATLARSVGRGASASRDYMQANDSFNQIAVVQQAERDWRKREEAKRQGEEREQLTKAYKIEKGRFEAEWDDRMAGVEADISEKIRVLQEVHDVARADVERGIEKRVANMRYKATSTLLQLEDTERKLARLDEFKQAAEVAARAHRQRRLETGAYERSKLEQGTRPRATVLELQEAEMRNLMQRCHSMRVAVRREKDQALEVFKQKYRNLEADLTHAHAIEYSLRPEIGSVQVNDTHIHHNPLAQLCASVAPLPLSHRVPSRLSACAVAQVAIYQLVDLPRHTQVRIPCRDQIRRRQRLVTRANSRSDRGASGHQRGDGREQGDAARDGRCSRAWHVTHVPCDTWTICHLAIRHGVWHGHVPCATRGHARVGTCC